MEKAMAPSLGLRGALSVVAVPAGIRDQHERALSRLELPHTLPKRHSTHPQVTCPPECLP